MNGNGNGGIVGLYLAAGQSRRMGCHKLALPVGESTLGSIALHRALQSCLDRVLVITRPDDSLSWLDSKLFDSPLRDKWRPMACEQALFGQAYSLRCGVQAAQKECAEAVVILLADQPLIQTDRIDEIVTLYRESFYKQQQQRLQYVARSENGITKPPVLFDAQLFPQLLELEGDEGARKLLRQGKSLHGQVLLAGNEECLLDVDTKADYENLLHHLLKSQSTSFTE